MKNPAQLPKAKNLIRTSLATALTDLQSVALIAAQQIAIPLLLLGAGLLLVQPCAATPFQWEYTGSLNTARLYHSATLLPNGEVLVAGGDIITAASAELYDPATGIWTITGSLNRGAREAHTATLLPNGKVLVAGGFSGDIIASAEVYRPATGTWTVTGRLNTARWGHTATLLPNGKVLVAGGQEVVGGNGLASAELYDPATGIWTFTGSLNTGRENHTATLLPNGEVLVAGGFTVYFPPFASAELYDPATGIWTVTGSLNTARVGDTATLLSDGTVLVAGGSGDGVLASAELYDSASGTWSVTGSLGTGRYGHTATLLTDGKVLVVGGSDYNTTFASGELYDPATETWTVTGSLNTGRGAYTMTLLPNGEVLVAGGADGADVLASAELYDPGIVAATKVQGHGSVDNQGNEVTFNFSANQADDISILGSFSFCDPAGGICRRRGKIQSLSITGNTAVFSGTGHLEDGSRVRFRVRVTDNGSPGTSDTISITLSNGYSVSGTLISGDIRIF